MQTQKLSLSNENIALAIQTIREFFAGQKVEQRTVLRTTLSAEEVLLKYQEHFGTETPFALRCTKRMGRAQAEILLAGESFDPFAETEEGSVLHALLVNAGLEPAWAYRRGSNCVVFTAQGKKKISVLMQIVIALLGGLGLGLAAAALPNDLGLTLSQKLLSPISSTIMGFLSASAMVLIFLSVANGICSMGDISTFNRIGKKLIVRLLVMLLPAAVVAAAFLLPFFRIGASGTSALDISAYFEMLLDIVPSNPVEPFLTGNTLQIIFLAACLSAALLVLGLKTSGVTELVMQANLAAQTIVVAVTRLLPIVVFCSMYTLVVSGALASAGAATKLLALEAAGVGLMRLLELLRVSISKHISPLLLLKKLAPVMAISFATSSSAAALSATLETTEKKLGVDRQLAGVGVPLGPVMFKPHIMVFFPVSILCLAEMYGVEVTLSWFITLMLTSLFVSVAIPPVPGGTVSCLILMLAQFGIPAEAIAVVVALDAINDRINTTAKIFCLEVELVELADSLGLLDIGTLRAANNTNE